MHILGWDESPLFLQRWGEPSVTRQPHIFKASESKMSLAPHYFISIFLWWYSIFHLWSVLAKKTFYREASEVLRQVRGQLRKCCWTSLPVSEIFFCSFFSLGTFCSTFPFSLITGWRWCQQTVRYYPQGPWVVVINSVKIYSLINVYWGSWGHTFNNRKMLTLTIALCSFYLAKKIVLSFYM